MLGFIQTAFREFENPDMIESIPDIIEIQEEKSGKILKFKDIKSLKQKNNDMKSYSKIDFNVADLPRGTYYIQVTYDEKTQKGKDAIRIILN